MASGTIGRVEPFQLGVEDWDQYTERLEHYFVCNEIPNEKKVTVLITIVGTETYGLLCNLIAPAKPASISYDELVSAIKDHLKPKPLVIAERFKFHRRNQGEGEGIAKYMAELRKLAGRCQFGGYLEEALRDRLVCGLRDEAIQRKLLTMDALTLSRAYEIAHGMETAQRQASELQASTKVEITVNRVHWSNQRTPKTAETAPCYRYGKSNHVPEVCYYRRQKCHNCKKVGHIARMCKQAKPQRTGFVDDPKSGEDSTESPGEELPLMHIHTIQPKVHKKGALLVDINLDGKPLSMEVDTGASVSLISELLGENYLQTED